MVHWIISGLILWTDIMLTFILIHRIVEDRRREKAIMARADKELYEQIKKGIANGTLKEIDKIK
jgi:uncharacterized membrane protein